MPIVLIHLVRDGRVVQELEEGERFGYPSILSGNPPNSDVVAAGETINDIYMVRDPILRSTTKGDLYIAMFLGDRTGQLNGRMWQATELVYKSLPKPGFSATHSDGRYRTRTYDFLGVSEAL